MPDRPPGTTTHRTGTATRTRAVTHTPKNGLDRASLRSSSPSRNSAEPRRSASAQATGLLDALQRLRGIDGSDLHLAAGEVPHARVDGLLVPLAGLEPWSAEVVDAEIRALMTAEQEARFDAELELDFAWEGPDGLRVRLNAYRQRGTTGAALRLVPGTIRSLRQLGLPESIGDLAALPRGLVLVTGPTGSGKSATLAALVDSVNRTRACHILTIEDPIELVHRPKQAVITQREIDRDTRDYASALRQALRQDPDVILLGELRDRETIAVALNAAETGHLVLATLHTPDAAQAVSRIVDVFPAGQQEQVRAQLALTLKGVIAQNLVPRATGVGRVVAAEVMIVTPAIANLIRSGRTHQIPSAIAVGAAHGMVSMDQRLAELVLEGSVTADEALRVAHDPELASRLLRGTLSDWDAPLRRTA
jgi:twitching motility protein PilT